MNFQELLDHREALIRQARLANGAFAWQRLVEFTQRAQRAGLRGPAVLHLADPAADRPLPALLPLVASRAVVDEHFTDEDLADLADGLLFAALPTQGEDIPFCFESMLAELGEPLRRELAAAGVRPPPGPGESGPRPAAPGNRDNFPGRVP